MSYFRSPNKDKEIEKTSNQIFYKTPKKIKTTPIDDRENPEDEEKFNSKISSFEKDIKTKKFLNNFVDAKNNNSIKIENLTKTVGNINIIKNLFSPITNLLSQSPYSFEKYLDSFSRENINVLNLVNKNKIDVNPIGNLNLNTNSNNILNINDIQKNKSNNEENVNKINSKNLNLNLKIKEKISQTNLNISNRRTFNNPNKCNDKNSPLLLSNCKNNQGNFLISSEMESSEKNKSFLNFSNEKNSIHFKNLFEDLNAAKKLSFFYDQENFLYGIPDEKKKIILNSPNKNLKKKKNRLHKKKIEQINNSNNKNLSKIDHFFNDDAKDYISSNKKLLFSPISITQSGKKKIFECLEENMSTVFNSQKKSKIKQKLKTRVRKSKFQIDSLNSIYENQKEYSKEYIYEASLKIGLSSNKIYKWLWDKKNKENLEKITLSEETKNNNCIFKVNTLA